MTKDGTSWAIFQDVGTDEGRDSSSRTAPSPHPPTKKCRLQAAAFQLAAERGSQLTSGYLLASS